MMLKQISLRIKVIVLIIFSVIGIGIVVFEGLSNREYNPLNINENKVEQNTAEVKDNKEELKQKVIQKESDNKESKLEQKWQTGYTAFNNKKYKEAIEIENQVIAEEPTFYKAYSVKGIALCYSGDFQQGMSNIDKSLELKQDYGYGRFNKALAYELYAHYDEALNWYDKALAVENYVWSYYGKASIYGRRGDVANTIKYLKIAINISSDVKNVAKNEEDFKAVRDSKEFQQLVN